MTDQAARPSYGVHLRRTKELRAEVDALAALVGGRVGLAPLLGDLDRQARRAYAAWGRAVDRAWTWDAADRRDRDWWPQGISTAAEAAGPGSTVVVSWYSKAGQGARLTFLDLASLRYRHVLLVEPSLGDDGSLALAPLRVHAGGIAWAGDQLHVAATGRGIVSASVHDLLRVPDPLGGPDLPGLGVVGGGGSMRLATRGYRWLLPVRSRYVADADDGHVPLRYSFLSVDRDGPALVAGEYGRGRQSTRLARFPLDPVTGHLVAEAEGASRPALLDDASVRQMQGAVRVAGRYHVTTSHGPWTPGSVHVGVPGSFRRHRWATPIGPEDLDWDPSADLLWSVTEHPHRRWVFTMRRDWFDR